MATSNLIDPLIWQGTPYKDRDAWSDFMGQHWIWHIILAKQSVTRLVALDDMRSNLLPHAGLHQDLALALGVEPAGDLVSYDLNDRDSFAGFMLTHSLDHARLRQAAGL